MPASQVPESRAAAAVPLAFVTVITVAFTVARYSQDPVNVLRWILLMLVAAVVVTVYLTIFPRYRQTGLLCWLSRGSEHSDGTQLLWHGCDGAVVVQADHSEGHAQSAAAAAPRVPPHHLGHHVPALPAHCALDRWAMHAHAHAAASLHCAAPGLCTSLQTPALYMLWSAPCHVPDRE